MSKDSQKRGKTEKRGVKRGLVFARRIIAVAAVLLLGLYITCSIILATPFAAARLSQYVMDMTGETMRITSIKLSGITLVLNGVVVGNPPGFPSGPLLSARSIRIAPDLPQLILGKRSLSLLQSDGLRIILQKNAAGKWNHERLMQYLRTRKKPSAETYIGHLVFSDASVKVNEFAVGPLSLSVNDFSTKGSTASRLAFSGSDGKGNPFSIVAENRFGDKPDLRVKIAAPSFSLANLSSPQKKSTFDVRNGFLNNVAIAASYRSGDVAAKGHVGFDRIGIRTKERETLLRGTFDFDAGYTSRLDKALVRRASLVVNNAIRLDGSGTVRHVKTARDFDFALVCNTIKVENALASLREETVKNISLRGTVSCADVRFRGDLRRGITSGGGKVFIRNGEAAKRGKTLFDGLSSDLAIARTADGWGLRGNLSVNAYAGTVRVDNATAEFAADLSTAFKVVQGNVQGKILEMPVRGELRYVPTSEQQYFTTINVTRAPAPALNRLIHSNAIAFSSGTFDLSLKGAGKGPGSFHGEATGRVYEIKGRLSGKTFNTGRGRYTSRFSKSGNRMTGAGEFAVDGAAFSEKPLSCSFAYSVADGNLSVTGGTGVFGDAAISFAEVRGKLPVADSSTEGKHFPLVFHASGVNFTKGATAIKNASGTASATFTSRADGGILTGNAAVAVEGISFRKHSIGSAKARVALSPEESVVDIDGKVLDGSLTGVITGNPFTVSKGVSFKGAVQGFQAAKLSELLPERLPVTASAGKMDMKFSGNWSGDGGGRYAIEGSGDGMTIAAKTGRTIVNGAALTVNAEAAGSNIAVKQAVLSWGKDVVVKASGTLSDASSPSRTGSFSINLDTTNVTSVLDTFANLLPKPLQEANGSGTMKGGCNLDIRNGKVLLQGAMQVDNAVLEIPSQKVVISGVGGTVPFSIFLTGARAEKPPEGALAFTRENYPVILTNLQHERKEGVVLKVAKIRFGALETTDMNVRLNAQNGRIVITSIESNLYNGLVLGKGFYLYDHGSYYGVDLLLNDFSLRLFCSSYPALKGYISGLLDGVISIYGEKGGIPAMAGFMDLWAHEGKTEKMLVSKEFLQRLAGKKLKGFFFRNDRPYNHGEISAYLLDGDVTFETLDISHTNFLGMKDLNVSVAPVQNRIGLDHLLQSIREAAARGKATAGEPPPEAPTQPDLKWLE